MSPFVTDRITITQWILHTATLHYCHVWVHRMNRCRHWTWRHRCSHTLFHSGCNVCHNERTSSSLSCMFAQTNSVHDHNTRGGTNNIHVKKYNVSICQRTFAHMGAKVWDYIPELIKNAISVECFKTMFFRLVRKDLYESDHF